MYWGEIVTELARLLESSTKKHDKQRKFDRLMLYLKNSPYLDKNIKRFDRRLINQILEAETKLRAKKRGIPYGLKGIKSEEGRVIDYGEEEPAVKSEGIPHRFKSAKKRLAVKFKRFLDNSPVIEKRKVPQPPNQRTNKIYWNEEYLINPRSWEEEKTGAVFKGKSKPSKFSILLNESEKFYYLPKEGK